MRGRVRVGGCGASGCGGGGWYGGGHTSGSSTDYVKGSGGGSGFVNTAANASYRPTGYIGLELDSGTSIAGNLSFPSTDGGYETGHSGNGYAKITRPDPSTVVPLTFEILEDGIIGWKIDCNDSNSVQYYAKTIQYSKNGGEWMSITSSSNSGNGTEIPVLEGDVIQFKGNYDEYGRNLY